MSNAWVRDIQTTVYSRVKALCLAKLKTKYPDINVTMNGINNTTAKYPSVFLDFLQSTERGKDLVGQDINAVTLTLDIEVTATSSQGMSVADEVSNLVLDTMKEMRFNATLPFYQNTDGNYRTVARYSRIVGNGEQLFNV